MIFWRYNTGHTVNSTSPIDTTGSREIEYVTRKSHERVSESEISQEVDDLSDNLDQLLAETPQNECKSQADNAAGKGKPHKTTEQEDDLLAEIADSLLRIQMRVLI